MKILLDTHIFLWFISGDSRLSTDVRDAIRASDNEIYLSVVSVWESMVKYQLGKLPLPEHPETYLPKQRDLHKIDSLSLAESSVTQLAKLPYFIVIRLTVKIGIQAPPFNDSGGRLFICSIEP